MLTEKDKIIYFELLAEMQKIDDNSADKFSALLYTIKGKLEANRPIKEIKKIINQSNINEDLKETLETIINQQAENITGEEEKIKLTAEAVAGYTYLESIKLRKDATKKQAIRFMAQAREALKDNQPIQDIIDNELKKYKSSLETFYRTQTKRARQDAYAKVDKKLSKKVKGWISIAVLDNRTSAICLALHNKFYSKKDYPTRFDVPNPPPRHPNCRSILLTVWEGTKIEDYKTQDVDTFLRENPEIAEDILGKKKYRIFITGKAKIKSFVDIKGSRFYTNDEIIKRLGIKSKARLEKINGGAK